MIMLLTVEEANSYDSSPCVHGTCSANATGFFCICQTGYQGILCNGRYAFIKVYANYSLFFILLFLGQKRVFR